MSRKFKITPSESRNLLVPDTARMIERYVNREIDSIYDLAEEIYENTIPFLVNEEIVRKEMIIDRLVNIYIDNFGINFTALLEKYGDQIRRESEDFLSEIEAPQSFLNFILNSAKKYVSGTHHRRLWSNIDVLIYDFWTGLAREEGYLAPDKSLNYLLDQIAGGLKGIEE